METVPDEGSLPQNGEPEAPTPPNLFRPIKRECLTPPNPEPRREWYKCPICIQDVRQGEPVATKCGHVFCKECIKAAIRTYRVCPLCKKRTNLRNLQRIFL